MFKAIIGPVINGWGTSMIPDPIDIDANFPVWYDEERKLYLFVLKGLYLLSDPESVELTDFLGNYVDYASRAAFISDSLGPDIIVNGSKILKPKLRTNGALNAIYSAYSDRDLYWESEDGDLYRGQYFIPASSRTGMSLAQTLRSYDYCSSSYYNVGNIIPFVNYEDRNGSQDTFPKISEKHYRYGWYEGSDATSDWYKKSPSVHTYYARGLLNPDNLEDSDESISTVTIQCKWSNIYRSDDIVQQAEEKYVFVYYFNIIEKTNWYSNFLQMFGTFNGICGTSGRIVVSGYEIYSKNPIDSVRIDFIKTSRMSNGYVVYDALGSDGLVMDSVKWNEEAKAYVYGKYGSKVGWWEITSWPTDRGGVGSFVYKELESSESSESPESSEVKDFDITCMGKTCGEKTNEYVAGVEAWV